MSEQLPASESKIPSKWKVDLGGQVIGEIGPDRYNFLLKPEVFSLPPGQEWTDANLSRAPELKAAAERFREEGCWNNILFTFQASNVKRRGFNDWHSERLFDEEFPELSFNVDKGLSQEATLLLGTCSYYEHLAWMTGEEPGLVNPRAMLVSLQTRTEDDQYVFARRRNVSTGAAKIGVIGGTYDMPPTQVDIRTPDDVALAEAIEELGVDASSAKVRLIALLEDKLNRPVLYYGLRLKLSAEELREKIEGHLALNTEHSELIIVPDTSRGLLDFARSHGPSEFHPPADLFFQIALAQAIQRERLSEQDSFVGGGTTSYL